MCSKLGPITTRPLTTADTTALAALHASVFGPGRFVRTAYRVREGTPLVTRYCRGAFTEPNMIAALRMTPILIGQAGGALMLGPLAVGPDHANLGYGRRLIAESTETARSDGRTLILLVGNMSYYGRLGYVPVPPGQIVFPGPVDPARVLAIELVPGAVAAARGLVAADQV